MRLNELLDKVFSPLRIVADIYFLKNNISIMNPKILNLDDLKAATGYKQINDVESCLRKNGVRFLHGRAGSKSAIYTTVDALNAAMGLHPDQPSQSNEEITF